MIFLSRDFLKPFKIRTKIFSLDHNLNLALRHSVLEYPINWIDYELTMGIIEDESKGLTRPYEPMFVISFYRGICNRSLRLSCVDFAPTLRIELGL